MTPPRPRWTLEQLHHHLQYAVDLELWTIPFYMSAMYSIVNRAEDAFQLVQSVVHQEMLHVQLVSNVANAYGLRPRFPAPRYEGTRVPHLDFALDTPNPIAQYSPYTAEIGPLDVPRVNAMCLIEYPEWKSGHAPDLKDDVREYGSIGEFYDALEYGARELAAHVRGGVSQVSYFERFYAEFPQQTVTLHGAAGQAQAQVLMNAIRDQGEGASDAEIEPQFRNTADDPEPEDSHYQKFVAIRDGALPATYPVKAEAELTDADRAVAAILVENFTEFRGCLERLFSGERADDFFPAMVRLGANILNCWQHGVVPRFS
jgi:hypothetical protein